MRVINVLAAVAAISLAGGVAVAKPAASKEKKVCRIVEPAIGRIPARRVCTVKAEATPVAAKATGADAQSGAAAGGRD